MVRAIIFDCYGVLAKEKLLPFRKKYFGSDPKTFGEVTDMIGMTTAGHLSYADFIAKVSDLASITEKSAREQIEGNAPNEELFEYIARNLKPKYKIGLLSNAASNRLEALFTPEQLSVFDATALSFEIRAIKPEAAAYKAIAERLKGA